MQPPICEFDASLSLKASGHPCTHPATGYAILVYNVIHNRRTRKICQFHSEFYGPGKFGKYVEQIRPVPSLAVRARLRAPRNLKNPLDTGC